MMARMTRKMQVPAYDPVLDGAQLLEKRGVDCEPKKVISIRAIDSPPDDEW